MPEHKDSIPFSVSQNYLTSRKTISRLIRIAHIGKMDMVVEIGAGKGHITRQLADVCREVVSYEIDPLLCSRLKGQLPPNVRLVCDDFLRARLPSIPYRVFANIPFSRTTDIVRKLTSGDRIPEDCWLIMEKGAAKRFCGQPHSGLQSLMLKPFFHLDIRYYFQREDFHPAPHVDVVMLHIQSRAYPDIPPRQRKAYEHFLKACFQYGFYGPNKLLSARQARNILRETGRTACIESEEMRYVEWLCLFRWWYNAISKK